jgi:hypothetical protein
MSPAEMRAHPATADKRASREIKSLPLDAATVAAVVVVAAIGVVAGAVIAAAVVVRAAAIVAVGKRADEVFHEIQRHG